MKKAIRSNCRSKVQVRTCTYSPKLNVQDIKEPIQSEVNADSSEAQLQQLMNDIKSSISTKLHRIMTSEEFGFEDSEVDDYSRVEVSSANIGDDNEETIRVEVRVELSYDGMEKVKDALDPIIESYDSYAYFDFDEPGIMSAYVRVDQVDMSVYGTDNVLAGAYKQDDSIIIDAEDLRGKSREEIEEILKDAPVGSEIIHIRNTSNRFNMDAIIEKQQHYSSNYHQGFSSPHDWKTLNEFWSVGGSEDPYIDKMIYEAVNGKNKYYGLTSDVLKAHGVEQSVEENTSIEATEDLSMYPESFEHAYTLAKNDFMNDYGVAGAEVHIDPMDTSAEDGEVCLIVTGINHVGRSTQGKVYVDTDADVDYIYQALDETAEAIGMEPGSSDIEMSTCSDKEDVTSSTDDKVFIEDIIDGLEENGYDINDLSSIKEGLHALFGYQGKDADDVIEDLVAGGFVDSNVLIDACDKVYSDTEEDEFRAEDNPWINQIDWAMSQLPSWFKVQGENLDYNVTYDGQTAHVEFFLFDGARYTYTIDGEGPYSTNQVEQISFDLQDYFEGLPVGSDEEDDVMSGTHSYDYYLGDNVTYNGQEYVIIDDQDNLLTLRPKDRFGDNDFDNPELGDSSEDVFLEPWQLAQAQKVTGASEEDDEDLPMVDQEYTSENTSINKTKLPAVYNMIHLNPGDVVVDFGGGKWDTAVEHFAKEDITICVYDPYNRSAEHNKEVLRILRENGGADAAVNSNVLNVIKEPEARKNVLENISRITKPGAPIYITVYEGKGNGQEGPTKSGYQLNRKTADYLEEIQEVFPDATRKGKLITAHNSGSVTSSTVEGAFSDLEDEYLSPPEYNEPTERDVQEEVIELDVNQVIIVDVDGDYEWEDDTYKWAAADGISESWRSEDGVYIDDKTGVVEKIDDLISPQVPTRPGKYRVTGDAELVYEVSGILEYKNLGRSEEEYEEEVDADHAAVTYSYRKSQITNLKITPVR